MACLRNTSWRRLERAFPLNPRGPFVSYTTEAGIFEVVAGIRGFGISLPRGRRPIESTWKRRPVTLLHTRLILPRALTFKSDSDMGNHSRPQLKYWRSESPSGPSPQRGRCYGARDDIMPKRKTWNHGLKDWQFNLDRDIHLNHLVE